MVLNRLYCLIYFGDFGLRIAEHKVSEKCQITGHQYLYRIIGHCSPREQRSVHSLSGFQRLKMILYTDDIVLLCSDINELSSIVDIYHQTFSRFGLTISTDKTKTMAFNDPEDIKSTPSLISIAGAAMKNVRTYTLVTPFLIV